MSNIDDLMKLSANAPAFVKSYKDKQSTLAAQYAKLASDMTLDTIDKQILRRWIENNEVFLRSNVEKYNRAIRVMNMDVDAIVKLANEIDALKETPVKL